VNPVENIEQQPVQKNSQVPNKKKEKKKMKPGDDQKACRYFV
jgi:hypothetical protein